MIIFKNDEAGYLEWAKLYKNTGFILNVDDPQNIEDYPKLHLAKHQCVTSSKKTNYTVNTYFKVCSENRSDLESWSQQKYAKPVTPCGTCFRSNKNSN